MRSAAAPPRPDKHLLAGLERALRVTEEAYGVRSAEAAAARAELAVALASCVR